MATEQTLSENTPVLYSLYGKDYLYNDLLRDVDTGMESWLQSLKYGVKDQSQFRDAVYNILTGLKDKSITFEDGRFHDTKGRYYNFYQNPNEKNPNKDYYGLSANYIYSKMGLSNPYKPLEAPEDTSKIKWDGANAIGKALIRYGFSSDTPYLDDFIALDTKYIGKGKKKTRSKEERIRYLKDWLTTIRDDFDTHISGMLLPDKDRYIKLINEAIGAVDTDGFGDNDYYALRRATGIDFRPWFGATAPTTNTNGSTATNTSDSSTTNGTTATASTDTSAIDSTSTGTSVSNTNTSTSWEDYLSKIPNFIGTPYKYKILPRDLVKPEDKTKLLNLANTADGNKLLKEVHSLLTNLHYDFSSGPVGNKLLGYITKDYALHVLLHRLKLRGKLGKFPGRPHLYYIPGTYSKSKGTGLVWDSSSNTITLTGVRNIPYLLDELKEKYHKTLSHKRGGILKAELGTKIAAPKGNTDLEIFNQWKDQEIADGKVGIYYDKNNDIWVSVTEEPTDKPTSYQSLSETSNSESSTLVSSTLNLTTQDSSVLNPDTLSSSTSSGLAPTNEQGNPQGGSTKIDLTALPIFQSKNTNWKKYIPDSLDAILLFNTLSHYNRERNILKKPYQTPPYGNAYQGESLPINGMFSLKLSQYQNAANLERMPLGMVSDPRQQALFLLQKNENASLLRSQADYYDTRAILQNLAKNIELENTNAKNRMDLANANTQLGFNARLKSSEIDATYDKQKTDAINAALRDYSDSQRTKMENDELERQSFDYDMYSSDIEQKYKTGIQSVLDARDKYVRAHKNDPDGPKAITDMDTYEVDERFLNAASAWKNAQFLKIKGLIKGWNYNSPFANLTIDQVRKEYHTFLKGGTLVPRNKFRI